MYSSAISSANYTPIPESTIRMEIALMAEKIEGQDESRDREGAVVATARLIIRAKDGDTAAFDQVVIGHQRRIISLAWRLLGDREDARDAAQETFLRVYKSLGRFDPAQDFISFDNEIFGLLKLAPWRIAIVTFPAPSHEEGQRIWRKRSTPPRAD